VIRDANQRIGDPWRMRWDSLRLFTPARYNGLPGWPFPAPAWSFPAKDEMAGYLEAYAARFELPVRTGVRVDRLSREGDRYVVAAGKHRYEADHVVVAAGAYQRPRIPAFAAELDPGIVQLHSSQYRDPSELQEGGVLVVGAANSRGRDRPGAVPNAPDLAVGQAPRPRTLPPRKQVVSALRTGDLVHGHPGADREDADGEDGSAEVPHWRRAPCPRPPARPHPAQGPHRRRDRAGAEDGGGSGAAGRCWRMDGSWRSRT
jgi:Pyridine nucleotide-disulphide oxidoreductase